MDMIVVILVSIIMVLATITALLYARVQTLENREMRNSETLYDKINRLQRDMHK